MALWRVLVYIQEARICVKSDTNRYHKLNDPIYQSEMHFLAKMSFATATLAICEPPKTHSLYWGTPAAESP